MLLLWRVAAGCSTTRPPTQHLPSQRNWAAALQVLLRQMGPRRKRALPLPRRQLARLQGARQTDQHQAAQTRACPPRAESSAVQEVRRQPPPSPRWQAQQPELSLARRLEQLERMCPRCLLQARVEVSSTLPRPPMQHLPSRQQLALTLRVLLLQIGPRQMPLLQQALPLPRRQIAAQVQESPRPVWVPRLRQPRARRQLQPSRPQKLAQQQLLQRLCPSGELQRLRLLCSRQGPPSLQNSAGLQRAHQTLLLAGPPVHQPPPPREWGGVWEHPQRQATSPAVPPLKHHAWLPHLRRLAPPPSHPHLPQRPASQPAEPQTSLVSHLRLRLRPRPHPVATRDRPSQQRSPHQAVPRPQPQAQLPRVQAQRRPSAQLPVPQQRRSPLTQRPVSWLQVAPSRQRRERREGRHRHPSPAHPSPQAAPPPPPPHLARLRRQRRPQPCRIGQRPQALRRAAQQTRPPLRPLRWCRPQARPQLPRGGPLPQARTYAAPACACGPHVRAAAPGSLSRRRPASAAAAPRRSLRRTRRRCAASAPVSPVPRARRPVQLCRAAGLGSSRRRGSVRRRPGAAPRHAARAAAPSSASQRRRSDGALATSHAGTPRCSTGRCRTDRPRAARFAARRPRTSRPCRTRRRRIWPAAAAAQAQTTPSAARRPISSDLLCQRCTCACVQASGCAGTLRCSTGPPGRDSSRRCQERRRTRSIPQLGRLGALCCMERPHTQSLRKVQKRLREGRFENKEHKKGEQERVAPLAVSEKSMYIYVYIYGVNINSR